MEYNCLHDLFDFFPMADTFSGVADNIVASVAFGVLPAFTAKFGQATRVQLIGYCIIRWSL